MLIKLCEAVTFFASTESIRWWENEDEFWNFNEGCLAFSETIDLVLYHHLLSCVIMAVLFLK